MVVEVCQTTSHRVCLELTCLVYTIDHALSPYLDRVHPRALGGYIMETCSRTG